MGGTAAIPCLRWFGLARIWSGRGRSALILGVVLVLQRKRFLVEMGGGGKISWNQLQN